MQAQVKLIFHMVCMACLHNTITYVTFSLRTGRIGRLVLVTVCHFPNIIHETTLCNGRHSWHGARDGRFVYKNWLSVAS